MWQQQQPQGYYYSGGWTPQQPPSNPTPQSTDPSDWAQKAVQWAQQKQIVEQQQYQQQQQQQQYQQQQYQQPYYQPQQYQQAHQPYPGSAAPPIQQHHHQPVYSHGSTGSPIPQLPSFQQQAMPAITSQPPPAHSMQQTNTPHPTSVAQTPKPLVPEAPKPLVPSSAAPPAVLSSSPKSLFPSRPAAAQNQSQEKSLPAAAPETQIPNVEPKGTPVQHSTEENFSADQKNSDEELAERMKLFKEQLEQMSKKHRAKKAEEAKVNSSGDEFQGSPGSGPWRGRGGGGRGGFNQHQRGRGRHMGRGGFVNPEFEPKPRGGGAGIINPEYKPRGGGRGHINPEFESKPRGGHNFRRGTGEFRGRARGRGQSWEHQQKSNFYPDESYNDQSGEEHDQYYQGGSDQQQSYDKGYPQDENSKDEMWKDKAYHGESYTEYNDQSHDYYRGQEEQGWSHGGHSGEDIGTREREKGYGQEMYQQGEYPVKQQQLQGDRMGDNFGTQQRDKGYKQESYQQGEYPVKQQQSQGDHMGDGFGTQQRDKGYKQESYQQGEYPVKQQQSQGDHMGDGFGTQQRDKGYKQETYQQDEFHLKQHQPERTGEFPYKQSQAADNYYQMPPHKEDNEGLYNQGAKELSNKNEQAASMKPTIPSLQKEGVKMVIPGLGSVDEPEVTVKEESDAQGTDVMEEIKAEEKELKSNLKTQIMDVFGSSKAEKMVKSLERIMNQLQTLKGLESSLKVLQVVGNINKGPSDEEQTEAARKKVAALLATESDSDGETENPPQQETDAEPSSSTTAPSKVPHPSYESSNNTAREFDGTFNVKPNVFGTYSNDPDAYNQSGASGAGAADYRDKGSGRDSYNTGSFERGDYRDTNLERGNYAPGRSGLVDQGELERYGNRRDQQQHERIHGNQGYEENYPRGQLASGPGNFNDRRGRSEHEGFERLRDNYQGSGAGDSQRYRGPPGEDMPPRDFKYLPPLERGGPYHREEGYGDHYRGGGGAHFRGEMGGPWERQDYPPRGPPRESSPYLHVPMDIDPKDEKVNITQKLETIDYSHGAAVALSGGKSWGDGGGGASTVQSVDYNHGHSSAMMEMGPGEHGGYPAHQGGHPYGGFPPPAFPNYEGYPPGPMGGAAFPSTAPAAGSFLPGMDPASLFAIYSEQAGGADSKRKALPKWLREELEKMEKKKQKELEKEAQKRARHGEEGQGRRTWRDEVDSDEEEKPSGRSGRSYRHSKSPSNSSGEAEPARKRLKKTELVEDEEDKKANMMVKIRKMLTEILLDVTNQEIQSVVTEVYEDLKPKLSFIFKEPKTKPRRFAKPSILGLGVYESSSDSEEEEQNQASGAKILSKSFTQAIAKAFSDGTNSKKGDSTDEKKRKSKWDMKDSSSSRKDSHRDSKSGSSRHHSSSDHTKKRRSSSGERKSSSSKSSSSSSSRKSSSSSDSHHHHHHKSSSKSHHRSKSPPSSSKSGSKSSSSKSSTQSSETSSSNSPSQGSGTTLSQRWSGEHTTTKSSSFKSPPRPVSPSRALFQYQ